MLELLAALAILCSAALVTFAVYVASEAWRYQIRLGKDLRRDLGFEHATPYIRCGRRTVDVLTVGALVAGGVFDRAGFRVGDIIEGLSITGLYKKLHCGRGSEVRLTVVEGGDGPPLKQRPRRVLAVTVPAPHGGPLAANP
jgi:hypothetical protein